MELLVIIVILIAIIIAYRVFMGNDKVNLYQPSPDYSQARDVDDSLNELEREKKEKDWLEEDDYWYYRDHIEKLSISGAKELFQSKSCLEVLNWYLRAKRFRVWFNPQVYDLIKSHIEGRKDWDQMTEDAKIKFYETLIGTTAFWMAQEIFEQIEKEVSQIIEKKLLDEIKGVSPGNATRWLNARSKEFPIIPECIEQRVEYLSQASVPEGLKKERAALSSRRSKAKRTGDVDTQDRLSLEIEALDQRIIDTIWEGYGSYKQS